MSDAQNVSASSFEHTSFWLTVCRWHIPSRLQNVLTLNADIRVNTPAYGYKANGKMQGPRLHIHFKNLDIAQFATEISRIY